MQIGTLLDGSRAAEAILAHRDTFVSIWSSLLHPPENCPVCSSEPQLQPELAIVNEELDACVRSFAGFLLGEPIRQSPIAQRWTEIQPTGELATDALTSLSLFCEALRQVINQVDDEAFAGDAIIPAASRFIHEVSAIVMRRAPVKPDQDQWEQVVNELADARTARANRIAAYTEISRAASTMSSLEELFERVRAACSLIMNGDDFGISIYDAASRAIVPRLLYIGGQRACQFENQPETNTLSCIVAETQMPLVVDDYVLACRERGIEPCTSYHDRPGVGWMGAPMLHEGRTLGVISVFSPRLPFDQVAAEMLFGIARQTAVALENNLLLTTHKRRVAQLKAVNQLARRMVSFRDPSTLLPTAVSLIHDLFGYAIVSVLLVEPESGDLVMKAQSGEGFDTNMVALRLAPRSRSIVTDVASSGRPAVVGDVTKDPRYLSIPQMSATRSEVAVPIYLEGNILGVLDVQSMRYNAFDDHDQTTLRTIADQIALALENARLFKEERERSQELSVLLATTRAASSSLVLDEVLNRLAEGIAGAAGVSACVICTLDDEEQTITPAASFGTPDSGLYLGALAGLRVPVSGSPVISQILNQSEPFFCCEVPDPAAIDGVLAEVFGGQGAIAVPLAARGKVFGVALLPGEEGGNPIAPARIRLIRGVADSAGLAIENAHLYEQSQALAVAEERGRIAQEIHDTLAQGLTAISLHLDLADAYLPNKPEQAAEKVRRALELTRQNLEEARRSVLDLRAARQHQAALPDALRKLVQTFSTDTGLHADFSAEGLTNRLSARVEMGLYRIVEEALANVRCHATSASHVRVRLAPRQDQVSLTIEDDGPGFEANAESAETDGEPANAEGDCWSCGFGLVSIRERAKLLRGTLDLQSARDKGTTLVVTLPFEGILQRKARTGNEETQA